jgi:hypothetical protein
MSHKHNLVIPRDVVKPRTTSHRFSAEIQQLFMERVLPFPVAEE